jgi:uncharacterized protein involved in exopolysaccharide biosynthesis
VDFSNRTISPVEEKTQDSFLLSSAELSPPELGQIELDTLQLVVQGLRLLWRERKDLLRWTAVCLVLSLSLSFLIPSQFEATTQLMPPKNQSENTATLIAAISSKNGEGLGALTEDLLGIQTSGALFTRILSSRTVEDRLIDRFDLMNIYWTRSRESARKKLARRTSITEDRKSGVIMIKVSDHSPQRAARMAAAYVDELNHLVVALTTSSAHRERVFIEDRLNVVKPDLDASAKALSEFSSQNAVSIDIKDQSRAMLEAAASLQGQLIATETQLRGLEQIYTGDNVRVRSLRAKVVELRRQLEKISGAQGDTGRPPAVAEDGSPYPSLRQLPALGVAHADLYRQTKIQEAVYEYLRKQYEMAKVNEAKEIPSVRVLDQPEIPEKRSFPPRLLIVCLGMFTGLLSGMAFVIGREKWHTIPLENPGKQLAQDVVRAMRRNKNRETIGS